MPFLKIRSLGAKQWEGGYKFWSGHTTFEMFIGVSGFHSSPSAWVGGPSRTGSTKSRADSILDTECSKDQGTLSYMEFQIKTMLSLKTGTSLVVQWLGLHASTIGGAGLIPGRATNNPQADQHRVRGNMKAKN